MSEEGRIKRAADRAAVRSAGGDPATVDAEPPATLAADVVPAASPPLRRRYGSTPTYPGPFASEAELLDAIWQNACEGFSLYATCKRIDIPYSTLRQWAEKDYGQLLSECLAACEGVRRGYHEEMMNVNLGNKDFNTQLFKFMMAVQHKDYRLSDDKPALNKPPLALPSDGAVETPQTEFELHRKFASFLDRHAAIKRGEIIALPAPAPVAKEG